MDQQRALEEMQRRNDKVEIAVGHTALENLLGDVERHAGTGHPGEPVPIRQDPRQTGNCRERGAQNAVAEGGLLGFASGKRLGERCVHRTIVSVVGRCIETYPYLRLTVQVAVSKTP